MKETSYTLLSGKKIYVYDGAIPLQLRDFFFTFAQNSLYKIDWKDGNSEKMVKHNFLYSPFSDIDNFNGKLWPYIQSTKIFEHVKDLKMMKSLINLSVPSDTHFAHAHPEKKVILYYANLEWEHHWHGETLFYTEDLNEIELAIRYVPGRIAVFDADIPHAIRPQSYSAANFRYTYTMTFN